MSNYATFTRKMDIAPVEFDTHETEKLKEPAKRWRNKWQALHHSTERSGRTSKPGDIVWGVKCFPSKDVAETHAEYLLKDDLRRWRGVKPFDYIGAFEVDQ